MKAIVVLALLAGLVITSCTRKAAVERSVNTHSANADSISIKNHQSTTVSINGAKIKLLLKDVINDSRCPTGVNCVWAGTVFAVLQVEGMVETLELEIRKPKTFQLSNATFKVELTAVSPYPEADKKINLGDYVATVKITRQ